MPSGYRVPLDPTQVVDMYAKGMSVNNIAQTLGCCFRKAVKVLRENGVVPKRHPKSHDFDIDSFKHRYLVLNHTLAEIARDFAERHKFLKVKSQKSKQYKRVIIPKEELERLVIHEKKSDIFIANQFGVSVQTVINQRKKYGIVRNYNPVTLDLDIAEIKTEARIPVPFRERG